MHIDGWTLALQAINFLVLVWILHRFLYRPVLAMIDRRRKTIDDSFAAAAARAEAAEAKGQEYGARLAAIESERQGLLDAAHREAERERQAAIEAARHEIAGTRDKARADLAAERDDALRAAVDWAAQAAVDIARKLLQDAGGVNAGLFLERGWKKLQSLDDGAMEAIRRDLAADPSITVAVAPALDDPALARWRQRIAEWAGDDVDVAFVSDSQLIAGAELRFPHSTIAVCWRDALAAALADMRRHDDAE